MFSRRKLLILFCLCSVFSSYAVKNNTPPPLTKPNATKDVFFSSLLGFDLEKRVFNEEVKSLFGKTIRIPGFMIPIEIKGEAVDTFLLVQSVPTCMHYPPPGPNQSIFVTMKDKKKVPIVMVHDAVWVTGELSYNEKSVYEFGDAVYNLAGVSTEIVNEKDYGKLGLFGGDALDLAPLSGNPFADDKKKKK
jgi:hypothetical protein